MADNQDLVSSKKREGFANVLKKSKYEYRDRDGALIRFSKDVMEVWDERRKEWSKYAGSYGKAYYWSDVVTEAEAKKDWPGSV